MRERKKERMRERVRRGRGECVFVGERVCVVCERVCVRDKCVRERERVCVYVGETECV